MALCICQRSVLSLLYENISPGVVEPEMPVLLLQKMGQIGQPEKLLYPKERFPNEKIAPKGFLLANYELVVDCFDMIPENRYEPFIVPFISRFGLSLLELREDSLVNVQHTKKPDSFLFDINFVVSCCFKCNFVRLHDLYREDDVSFDTDRVRLLSPLKPDENCIYSRENFFLAEYEISFGDQRSWDELIIQVDEGLIVQYSEHTSAKYGHLQLLRASSDAR